MSIRCNISDVSTSSCLTPPEEAELRNLSENSGSTQETLASSSTNNVNVGLRHGRGGYNKAVEMRSSKQGSGSNYKKSRYSQLPPPPSDPRHVLVAVVDKPQPKVSVQSMTHHENPCQIQASAAMDDTELETLTSKTNIMQSTPCESSTAAPSISQGVVIATEHSEQRPTDDKESLDTIAARGIDPDNPSSDASRVSASTISASHSMQQQQHTFTYLILEAEGPPPSIFWLDPEHFMVIFRELSKYTEQLISLNEQILDAMTVSQSISLIASPTTSPTSTKAPRSPEEVRRRVKGKEKAVNLEEERDFVAQSFTDLVMDSWPWIYKIPPEPKTVQMAKLRTKTAKRLKEAIDTFWSVQCHFEDQAQLILDVYQDPTVLEHGDRIRILKNQHLNNLLAQDSLNPHAIQLLLETHRYHHEKMEALSKQLQSIWLGIFMLLSDPDQKQDTKLGRQLGINSMHLDGDTSSSSSYHFREHHLSGNKRLGLKVTALLAVGAGMIAMALVLNTR